MIVRLLRFYMIAVALLLLCFPLACSQMQPVNNDQYPEQEGERMPDKVIETDEGFPPS